MRKGGKEGGGGNKHGSSRSEASGDVGTMLGVVVEEKRSVWSAEHCVESCVGLCNLTHVGGPSGGLLPKQSFVSHG